MPTAKIFGTDVTHSARKGGIGRPTAPGLRALLNARPDLHVRLTSQFDGMVDGMSRVDSDNDARAGLLLLLEEKKASSGLGSYVRPALGTDVLSIFSYSYTYVVYDNEHKRRADDMKALPKMPTHAIEASRSQYLGDIVDPIDWDDAIAGLRNIDEADELIYWLEARGFVVAEYAKQQLAKVQGRRSCGKCGSKLVDIGPCPVCDAEILARLAQRAA